MAEKWEAVLNDWALLVTVLSILIITVLVERIVKRAFNKFMASDLKDKIDDPTNYRFFYYALVALIYMVGVGFAIWNVPFLRHIAHSMLAGAGILAIVIGFASQQALGNIVSGIFIVIFKPYRINDRISMRDSLRGVVEDINLRHTVIRNFENQRIIVPNSVISNEVLINSNYSDDKMCRLIDFGISYGSDIDLARKIIVEEIEKHPLNLDNRKPEDIENGVPRVLVRVMGLNDSSVDLRAWAWAPNPPDGFAMECDVRESIKKRFDREGIVIPFPQRTISYLDKAKN